MTATRRGNKPRSRSILHFASERLALRLTLLMPDLLLDKLKQTFGYTEFRPLQREIIQTSLGGRDVFALLPTGGGKSLCFQLPALFRQGLTVVVSPLIALMKDQVDQLQATGIPATFLNSSLDQGEARARLRRLHNGKYRLLYAAPERLMLEDWKSHLRSWRVERVAIDEAHCISEWGHDFRPEYRQLAELRTFLPDVPIMALTATATDRVRTDIVQHLGLREPAIFVASFNRPNLGYQVKPKDQPLRQVLDFIAKRQDESGIVYCATRAGAERLAASLASRGLTALPYHAGLDSSLRAVNQELFLRDEARIICATIAFGMGINKPNVRWVIHYDLPKNLEGYYQETGRAGRDGLPADCLLLFSVGDAAKQAHFIEKIAALQEQQTARLQLRQMMQYAECSTCRRRELLAYFGEPAADRCENCDNCLEPPASYDGTTVSQKLLSCVYRIRQSNGFNMGMSHVIEVLTGVETEKVRRWGHQTLTTYGIGTDLERAEWAAIGRELLRLGYLRQSGGEFPIVEITALGLKALRSRKVIMLTRTIARPKSRRPARRARELESDEGLFSRLRELRKRLADERGVPAYVIFGDTTLREMARRYPATKEAMRDIFGVGERKLQQFGEIFAAEVAAYLAAYPRVEFAARD
jgi:ATP-dependent DNA helicase RecQ